VHPTALPIILGSSSSKSCKIIYNLNLNLNLNQINPKYPVNNYIIVTMSSQQDAFQTTEQRAAFSRRSYSPSKTHLLALPMIAGLYEKPKST